MGLFGGGNSASSNTTVTTNTNTTLGAQNGGIAAKNSTVNVLDKGAISGAFNFGKFSLASLERNFEKTLELANKSVQVADSVSRQSQTDARAVTDQVLSVNATKDGQAFAYAGVAVVVVVLAVVLRGGN